MTRSIFVFGSNLAGRHGKGAALYARQHHGAIYGQGVGLQGDSYGIPTKDGQLRTLPLEAIRRHVEDFKHFAADHPEMTFQVTAIGCGLAGYKPDRIAPMFADAPANCRLPDEFVAFVEKRKPDIPAHTPGAIPTR
ncbi:MAG TPA: hypothetical protein VMF69_15385 [Gemmataceae bacterium]|nr:hypothetical protein [Gemmataceae bacterium]